MVRRPTIRSSAVFGVALGGLLAGHALAYAELAPDPTTRASMLAATGHGYLSGGNTLAVVAALAGLAIVFLGRLTGAPGERATFGSFALRLVAFQATGFVVLEVTERLSVGAPLGDLAHALPIGLVFQVGLALLSAAFLRWLLAVADRVAHLLVGSASAFPGAWSPLWVSAPLAHEGATLAGVGNRGPPPRDP